ncbi:MobF family relaxase [Actinoallomurus sp. CA-150999]|uniref:MobF family relaxase n=1 Tax=Actinoallomurus sp. CA-150999 TaxID=3239887 RepID=UPI003D89B660
MGDEAGPAPAQVEYRLSEGAGCGLAPPAQGQAQALVGRQADHQLRYRMKAAERSLTWIGRGLAEVGITPGSALTEAQKDAARALMAGLDPRSGQVLVKPKMATDPSGTLSAAPLVAAITERDVDLEESMAGRWAAKRLQRLVRMVNRHGEAHRAPYADLSRLAEAAGIDLDEVYPAAEVEHAQAHAHRRVRIGNRGYDVTLDLPKSISVLYGLTDTGTAAEIEDMFADVVDEAVAALEVWCGYGMKGHHGDSKTAERVSSTGLLGWVMWHSVARPVEGATPDPHLYAHVVIANLIRRTDGVWSCPGAGGSEFHHNVGALGAFTQARMRHELTRRYGLTWRRDPHTGVWEIAVIPDHLRAVFSKRHSQIRDLLLAAGVDPEYASTAQARTAAATTREHKPCGTDSEALRSSWDRQANEAGFASDDLSGLNLKLSAMPGGSVQAVPSVEAIAAQVFDPETGVCAHTKKVRRAAVFAAVCDALPAGVADLAEAEALTEAVLSLEGGPAVPLPGRIAHLTHPSRYTTRDILAAETAALEAARAGYGAGLAKVPAPTTELAIEAYEASKSFPLSAEQRAVVERLTVDGHGVDAVIGVPGSGKTALMSAARAAWHAEGLTVAGAATAAVAAANLQASTDIPAATIASWLNRIRSGRKDVGLAGVDVLVVDEAAMVDDRDLAQILQSAAASGTKVVLIGDPMQLRAVGVGGAFAAIHRQVDGPTLTENRRQHDRLERRALQLWRDNRRGHALRTWGAGGKVHAGADRDDTLAALLADWTTVRRGATDLHDELAQVLILAGTNNDVDALNHAARTIRRVNQELSGPDHTYRRNGGTTLRLAVGDHVRIRINDYRSRTDPRHTDVLNGYRGLITSIDSHRNVQVEWQHHGPDGPHIVREWLSPAFIAHGGLDHGTALTVAAAQGLTCDHTLIYGLGLDPNTLYAAMSRDRHTARLYLPRNLLEDDTDRARHGQARNPAEELHRAIDAYAATASGKRADTLILTELSREPDRSPTRSVPTARRVANVIPMTPTPAPTSITSPPCTLDNGSAAGSSLKRSPLKPPNALLTDKPKPHSAATNGPVASATSRPSKKSNGVPSATSNACET